jgi:hypothetical protein
MFTLPSATLLATRTTQVARLFIRAYLCFSGEIAKHAAGEPTLCSPREARSAMYLIEDIVDFLGHELDRSRLRPRRRSVGVVPERIPRVATRRHPKVTAFGFRTDASAKQLVRLYQRFAGEVAKHMDGERALCEFGEAKRAMRFLEEAVEFLGHSIDRGAIRPRRTRPKVTPLGYGELRGLALAELQTHADWLTVNQVAERVWAARALRLDDAQKKHFRQKLREALNALLGQAYVERRLTPPLPKPFPAQEWRIAAKWRRER